MRVFRKAHIDLINTAIQFDAGIQTSAGKLQQAGGFTEMHMANLGLTKGLLKRLESWGLAKRGYKKTGKGHQLVWILVSPNSDEVQDALG